MIENLGVMGSLQELVQSQLALRQKDLEGYWNALEQILDRSFGFVIGCGSHCERKKT